MEETKKIFVGKRDDKSLFIYLRFVGINPIEDGLFWGCSRMGRTLPKICHSYPAMLKLGAVIPYLKNIQNLNESHDTPLDFC